MTSTLPLQGGDDVSAIVIDPGTHTIRIGYGQEDSPKQWWNSLCGIRSTASYTESGASRKLMFPINFYTPHSQLDICPCFNETAAETSGPSLRPEIFEEILRQSVEGVPEDHSEQAKRFGGLGLKFEKHPVLMSEPSKQCINLRKQYVESLFETFHVPALYFAKTAALSSFAVGRFHALVTDIGASHTTLSAVTDGYVLQRPIQTYPIGGNVLDAEIVQSITSLLNGKPVPPAFSIHTRSNDQKHILPSYLHCSTLQTARDLKETICQVSDKGLSHETFPNANPIFYELPDKTQIDVTSIQYSIPEKLFNTETGNTHFHQGCLSGNFPGLPQAISNCLLSCDVDIRRELLSSILLVGGVSLLPGLPDRVSNSLLKDETLLFGNKFKVISPSTSIERRFSTWLGGSILASLGTFQQLWVSRQEYNEYGMNIFGRRCS